MPAVDTSAWSGVRVDGRVEGGHRNDVWSGSAPTGRDAIRRSRRSAESLSWELELLAALHTDGFVVPVPLLTDDGRPSADGLVGLLDWDESRVGVVHLDVANLGVLVLDDAEDERALRCADEWEAANAWTAEPAYARRRLAQLRAAPALSSRPTEKELRPRPALLPHRRPIRIEQRRRLG